MPKSIYSVMSTIGGQIKSIGVSEGAEVKKGDTLIKLDTSLLEIELEKAVAGYDAMTDTKAQSVMAQTDAVSAALAKEKAKVALALSQTTGYDYESFNSAFGSELGEQAAQYVSALSGMQMKDVAVSADDYGAAQLDTAINDLEMTIKSLNKSIEQMTLKSEINGRVISINVHSGEVLAPGVPAMVIADTDNTYISAYVYEKDVKSLKEGMDVKILGDPGYYSGTVSRIAVSAAGVGDTAVFDTMTLVEITPEERFSRMPGAVVDVVIVTSSVKDALSLPRECFTKDNCVFTADEAGVLQKRTVMTGFRDMYYVQIITGVSKDEMVVVSPKDLTEGQKVEFE
jgi:HlyD family secretion protein